MLKLGAVGTYGTQSFESSTVPDISYIQGVQLKSEPAYCIAAFSSVCSTEVMILGE